MNKYTFLEQFLQATPQKLSCITLSFKQIELVIRSALPPAASKFRPWWANNSTSPSRQCKSWMNAGFKVDKGGVNLQQKWVRFRR